MFKRNKNDAFIISCVKALSNVLIVGGLLYFAIGKVAACDNNQQQNAAAPIPEYPFTPIPPAEWAPQPSPFF